MWKCEPSVELGKMSLHGNKKSYAKAQSLKQSLLEVDITKVEGIEKLLPPINVKSVRSFLNHVGFYRKVYKGLFKNFKATMQFIGKSCSFQFW